MRTGTVFNIQRFSVHDGPGIRTTVFLKGCSLRCVWCHNPEGQESRPQAVVMENRCIGCGACSEACPVHLSPVDLRRSAKSGCVLCGVCAQVCPTGAREIIGHPMHVDQVMSKVLADRVFYEESGGGVTVSGGEPLLQAEFAGEVLQSCRSRGIHTAIDTCGHGPWEALQRMASHADLILFDLKLVNSARHLDYTGASNESIVSNLRSLAGMHDAVWLRVPVIPGVNDSEDEMDSMVELASALPGARRVTLLPYHRAGVGKHARLGRAYPLSDTPTPSSDQMRRHAARFRAAGMLVSTGVF